MDSRMCRRMDRSALLSRRLTHQFQAVESADEAGRRKARAARVGGVKRMLLAKLPKNFDVYTGKGGPQEGRVRPVSCLSEECSSCRRSLMPAEQMERKEWRTPDRDNRILRLHLYGKPQDPKCLTCASCDDDYPCLHDGSFGRCLYCSGTRQKCKFPEAEDEPTSPRQDSAQNVVSADGGVPGVAESRKESKSGSSKTTERAGRRKIQPASRAAPKDEQVAVDKPRVRTRRARREMGSVTPLKEVPAAVGSQLSQKARQLELALAEDEPYEALYRELADLRKNSAA